MPAQDTDSDNAQLQDDGADIDGRRARWREHRIARRAELIDTVIEIVDRLGPQVGMDDIASAAGIAKPVFYRYFRDKADLFRSVGETVGEQLVLDVTAAIAKQKDPQKQLAAGIDTFLSIVERSPSLYRFVLSLPASSRVGKGNVLADYSTLVGVRASQVISDALRQVGRDTGLAEPWGFAIVGATRSAAERWLDHPVVSRQVLAEQLTDLLWSGLRMDNKRG